MPRSQNHVPSYRPHKSGQARVTLNGRDILLGEYDSAASRAEYSRIVGEWIANGRQIPDTPKDLAIDELVARYRQHVESYYRKPDGTLTSEVDNIRQALRPLRFFYGKQPASEFGPLKLKMIRDAMMKPNPPWLSKPGAGWSRRNINKAVGRIKMLFGWATESEMIPASIYHGLQAVKGLKHGRSDARESEPIMPVDDVVVEATLPHLSTTVAAMVRVQRLTGARPGEICAMRTADIDTSGEVWVYSLMQHKTQHHGKQRTIAIGPRAQAVLQPFLKPLNPAAYIFNPADSVAEMRERRNQARKTPAGQGNAIGTNRARSPKRKPGEVYNATSLRKAIARACDLAFPVPADLKGDQQAVASWRREHRWHPHQLRHTAATEIRKRFGLETAQTVLGHASAEMTQRYAERDQIAARRVAAEVG
jgi:integrase